MNRAIVAVTEAHSLATPNEGAITDSNCVLLGVIRIVLKIGNAKKISTHLLKY